MSKITRTSLSSVLLGDELGQLKLVQLDPRHVLNCDQERFLRFDECAISPVHEKYPRDLADGTTGGAHSTERALCDEFEAVGQRADGGPWHTDHGGAPQSKTLGRAGAGVQHKHRITRVYSECLQREPAASRAITNIRPIQSVFESNLDTTDKCNNLFLITNKVGQIFVCDTDAIRSTLRHCSELDSLHARGEHEAAAATTTTTSRGTILSPIYYNMNTKVPVFGAQPINQTNILVVYQNGDIQHVNIGQDILQSSLKMKRKAIRMLGLGYNSDARAVHWRLDGSTGICYYDSDAAHMDENDPLTDIVLQSPAHKFNKQASAAGPSSAAACANSNPLFKHCQYTRAPCISARKLNAANRLVPTQVINMISSHADQYKPSMRACKWSSITSLNLIYRKLALYDLVGSENFEHVHSGEAHRVGAYKLNDNRLAVGGFKYALRVYDVQTQKVIFNSLTGPSCKSRARACPARGEPAMVGDLDWLGGNKTTRKSPNMLATCSGVDSIVKVFDLRNSKPAFNIDLTHETENKWQPYKNYPRGCMFTSVSASGAPYSTAVPSQQLALGSTNGQLHLIDLRFVAKSNRTLGKLSGFCGGSIREIRFVCESFETTKMASCATDRFVRIHSIQTSFTSVVSQKLSTKVFLGTRPTCIQPVCDEITRSYLASLPHHNSDSHLSTNDSSGWSLL